MLVGKKVIILGDRDGIPSYVISALMEEAGYEVAYRAVECFLCSQEGVMDPDDQAAILRLARTHGPANLAVVLGLINPDSIRTNVTTLTSGDPSAVGPLHGVKLELKFYHVLESGFRQHFNGKTYDKHLGFYLEFGDFEQIEKVMEELRE